VSGLNDLPAKPPASDPAAHYDRITPAWSVILGDDFHHGLFDGPDRDLAAATQRLTETMAATAAPGPGARIVDIGCGTGTQACWLAQHHPEARVVGVSTSAVGIAAARRRTAAAGLTEVVRFACADALHTGLPDAAFDVVWLLESSQYIVPRSALMCECARLLAPGGRLALGDVLLSRPLGLRDLRRLHADLDALRDVFGDAVMGTAEEYREAASAAGLEITREIDLTEHVLPTFACWRQRAHRASDGSAAGIGAAWLARFVAGCDVMERFFVQGLVRYLLIGARQSTERARLR
jgi:27-O-demethylrifamycin SV methyltransferase